MFNPYDYYITPEEYEAAELNGISKKYLENRIREKGWDKQKAINTPIKRRKHSPELIAFAKSNGITYSQLRDRLYYGWDEVRAATSPLTTAAERREIVLRLNEKKRKYPLIAIELAQQNGISYSLFQYRMTHGWDLFRAVTLPPSPENRTMRMKEIYGDSYYRRIMRWIFLKRK